MSEVWSLLYPCLPVLQLRLLPMFTGRAVGVAAAIPPVCTTPLAARGVPGAGEAEQSACPPPKTTSHSLMYLCQLRALHAVLIHRVMLRAALREGEHICYLAALLCGQQPLGAAGQGLFQPSWLNPPANMSQSLKLCSDLTAERAVSALTVAKLLRSGRKPKTSSVNISPCLLEGKSLFYQ